MRMLPPRPKLNVAIALLSLVMSILLWSVVFAQNARPFVTRTFSVPLSPDGLKTEELAITKIPETVTVAVSAPEERYQRLRPDTFTALVDLSKAVPGSKAYPVQIFPPELREIATGSTINARVTVENIASRSMPVRIEMKGELADPSLRLENLTIDPVRVDVTGPKSQVDDVQRVRGFLELSDVDIAQGEPTDVPLEALDANGRVLEGVRTEPLFAKVRISIGSTPSEKPLLVVPSFEGSPAAGYVAASYTVVPTQVMVRAKANLLAALSKVSTGPIVLTDLKADKEFEVPINLPEGVRTVGAPRVRVRVRVVPVGAAGASGSPANGSSPSGVGSRP